MATERVKVGYVELTEEETERLLKEVRGDKNIRDLDELQELMDKYDSRLLEPQEGDVPPEKLAGEETPGIPGLKEEMIEIFPKREEGKHYRIKSSKK
ncbi:hypothetical protein [Indiicoccus explosivorum]|uniref:hypothetical protein n=1 Tax=Indiicoccus explosivorum TaxID=1917864 RepID=UPI000B435C9A|nr:hypothetical protein [Indiicoccus explosivorum]